MNPEEVNENQEHNENIESNIPQEDKNYVPSTTESEWAQNSVDVSAVQEITSRIKKELAKIIIGQETLIDQLMIALITGGHVLVEGVPGIAKTLTAKLLAKSLKTDFSRLQFTPDLMPSDVVGTNVFNLKSSEFEFNRGPIFSNIILIDEINRAPAKTQSALFEVMEEFQVTVDGTTYPMARPFFVMATQNPIEQEGTYKLPEAQLDRFIFKINIDYPSLEEEQAILRRFRNDFTMSQGETVQAVVKPKEIKAAHELVQKVVIKDELLDYIAAIINNTRNNGDLFLGASPRASLSIMKSSKTYAAMNGRDFVTPDDIKYVAYPVLNHRVILSPEREMEGYQIEELIQDILKKVEVPR